MKEYINILDIYKQKSLKTEISVIQERHCIFKLGNDLICTCQVSKTHISLSISMIY